MRLDAAFVGRCEHSGSPMFSARKFVTHYLKIVAFWLVLLVLVLAIVIVVSSDDENARDAIAGTLIFFMIATVSYGYCTGFGWGCSAGRVDAKGQATRGNRGYGWEKKQGSANPASKDQVEN